MSEEEKGQWVAPVDEMTPFERKTLTALDKIAGILEKIEAVLSRNVEVNITGDEDISHGP